MFLLNKTGKGKIEVTTKKEIWKREEVISLGRLGPLSMPPCPPIKQYRDLLTLLINAEYVNYTMASDAEIDALNSIVAAIERYKIKLINKEQNVQVSDTIKA